jgi:hypothetical protein
MHERSELVEAVCKQTNRSYAECELDALRARHRINKMHPHDGFRSIDLYGCIRSHFSFGTGVPMQCASGVRTQGTIQYLTTQLAHQDDTLHSYRCFPFGHLSGLLVCNLPQTEAFACW